MHRGLMLCRAFLFAVVLHVPFWAYGETLVVGVQEPGRKPFFWQDQQKQMHGIYVDLLMRVGKLAGVDIEFRMVPQARLIAEFGGGTIDIEPGVAKEWRPSEKDVANSRYTTSFMEMNDVLIFPKNRAKHDVINISDLVRYPDLRIGQVRGFYVPEGLHVKLHANEFDIARLVNNADLDAGFMNDKVAAQFKVDNHFNYEISAPLASTPVAFRIRLGKEKWVMPFDRAIDKLRQSGELRKILAVRP